MVKTFSFGVAGFSFSRERKRKEADFPVSISRQICNHSAISISHAQFAPFLELSFPILFSSEIVKAKVSNHSAIPNYHAKSPNFWRTRNNLEQMILEKLEAMNLDMDDIMQVMKAFRADDGLAKVFMNLTSTKYMRALVFEKLGRDPPPLP